MADAAAAKRVPGWWDGQLVADLSVLSFNGNKTVTCGGAAVLGQDANLIERCRHLSSTTRVSQIHTRRSGFQLPYDEHSAAVGLAQLERVDGLLDVRSK